MSDNKFNIEEVFKSELEDFEMEMPQNAWGNISNNIKSPVSPGLLSGSISQLVAVVAAAGIVGAIITLSLFNNKENEKQIEPATIKITETSLLNNKEITSDKIEAEETILIEKAKALIVEESEIKEFKSYIVEKEKTELIEENKNAPEIKVLVEAPIEKSDDSKEANSEEELTRVETSSSIDEETEDEVQSVEIIADILATPIGGYSPLLVAFSHTTENVKTNWNFDDGVEASAQNVSHTFSKPGTYTVELVLTNENGETSSAQTVIEVLSTSKIESIPNIFTPNNDGDNDRFVIRSTNIKDFTLYVFERNGSTIFETNNIEKGWNGENKYGEQVMEGKYFYLIKATGIDGKRYKEKGVVRLER